MTGEMKLKRVDEILGETEIRKSGALLPLPKELPTLSNNLKGFLKSELWIIGGYTSSGKTFLSLQMALEVARANLKVAYFSLEMSAEALILRLWGSLAGITPLKMQFGDLTLEELNKIKSTREEIKKLPLYFTDSVYQVSGILETLEDFCPDLVIVDFIQNILPEKAEAEYEKLSTGIITFQKLAKELNCPFIVCSQVSNAEAKEGVNSSIMGLKGSGGLSAAADLVLWIEKSKAGDEFKEEPKKRLYIRKNRRGSNFYLDMQLTFPNGLFKEV